jgi:pimeloyl-ACP methyl ester carboxylesterase
MTVTEKIFYECTGKGDAIVLISGLNADSLFWADAVNILNKNFRVITCDNRGIGKTKVPELHCTTQLMAQDIINVLDDLNIEAAYIVGHSLGGCIAQQLAILHPHRVRKLVLCSTLAKLTPIGEIALYITREMMLAKVPPALIVKNTLIRLYSNQFLSNPKAIEKLITNSLTKSFDESCATYFYQINALLQHDTTKLLAKIKCPTLVIAGEEDLTVPLQNANYLSEHIPNATLIIIPQMGHMLPIENPKLFCDCLNNFLL